MKHMHFLRSGFMVFMLFLSLAAMAQVAPGKQDAPANPNLKMYLVERQIPDAGKLTDAELKLISQTSCNVLREMGPKIQWIHSYVTEDKIFCVYKAENEALLKEHASKGGFPINKIIVVGSVISPATAE